MDKKYKLIAFDIDGTILNAEHRVCDRLKVVVNNLKQLGYLFTLVSARFPPSALSIALDLGLDSDEGIITLNGGFITNKAHEVIYSKTFSAISFNEHLSQINENIAISYYNGFAWVVNQENKYVTWEASAIDFKPDDFRVGELEFVHKISLMGDNDHLTVAQKFLQSIDDNLLVAFSHPNYLELATKSISKFSGLCAYAEIFGIHPSEIVAFGDGENDIPMLTNVGLGVAMDNAAPHVKAVAKDIAPHHLEEGVAIYLEQLIKVGVL